MRRHIPSTDAGSLTCEGQNGHTTNCLIVWGDYITFQHTTIWPNGKFYSKQRAVCSVESWKDGLQLSMVAADIVPFLFAPILG
jgi:hypothetical protein